jgi:hypothetical protein
MKISKRERDEAANYCSAVACWMTQYTSPFDPACDGYFSKKAVKLGDLAREYVAEFNFWSEEAWGEAEALLRDGWCPK